MKDATKEARAHISNADMLLSKWAVSGDLVFQMSAVRAELQAALACMPVEPAAEDPGTPETKGGGENGG